MKGYVVRGKPSELDDVKGNNLVYAWGLIRCKVCIETLDRVCRWAKRVPGGLYMARSLDVAGDAFEGGARCTKP